MRNSISLFHGSDDKFQILFIPCVLSETTIFVVRKVLIVCMCDVIRSSCSFSKSCEKMEIIA